jgi:phosphohistidine phosphatase SixA
MPRAHPFDDHAGIAEIGESVQEAPVVSHRPFKENLNKQLAIVTRDGRLVS